MDSRAVPLPSRSSPKKRAPRPGVPVPNWFDLPLLVPETEPVGGGWRVQHKYSGNHTNNSGSGSHNNEEEQEGLRVAAAEEETVSSSYATTGSFVVPKVSRLSPQKQRKPLSQEHQKQATMQQYAAQRKTFQVGGGSLTRKKNQADGFLLRRRRRSITQTGSAVTLQKLPHQRASLRDQIWKDLDRFGLWHLDDGASAGGGGGGGGEREETQASVDAAVDSILAQFQSQHHSTHPRNHEDGEGEEQEDEQHDEEQQGDATQPPVVFLTAVPEQPSRRKSLLRSSSNSQDSGAATPTQSPEAHDDAEKQEGEGDEEEEEDEDEDAAGTPGTRRHIEAPGLKRRVRLQKLHVFVEKQLQKRLFRNWETIEIALSGSGELNVNQIVKFLQNSEVKLSAVDASKVQTILNQHIQAKQAAAIKQATAESQAKTQETASTTASTPSSSTLRATTAGPAAAGALSYDAFRSLFQSKDLQETSKWKREFDREKVRLRVEKDIYAKELAILEDKVQKRLAESAKQMVHVLDTFHCETNAIPWDGEVQRLQLRDRFLEIIFSKPATRRLSQNAQMISLAALNAGLIAPNNGNNTQNVTKTESSPLPVEKLLSVVQIRSALLQKYSRNGHLDDMEPHVAAYLFHDLAADRIKQSISAFWKRQEADLWPERQLIFQFRFKKQVFGAWKQFTRHAEILRKFVMRKFVAWAFWTRTLHKYYKFYRTCFWPFYVWKRHLQQMIVARGKSSFLKNVVLTYIQLRHFRGWQTRFRVKKWRLRQIERLRKKKKMAVLRMIWDAWETHLRVKIQILRLWKSKGHVLQRLHKSYMVKVTFFVWRYYAILQQDMAARKYKCIHNQFPPGVGAAGAGVGVGAGVGAALKGRNPNSVIRGGQRTTSSASLPQGAPPLANNPHSQSSRSAFGGPRGGAGGGYGHGYGYAGPTDAHQGLQEGGDEDDDGDNDDGGDNRGGGRGARGGRLSSSAVATTIVNNIKPLSRIMETDLAPKIKRKTKLYDLCLAVFLQFREKDKREMTGNEICFRRIGKLFLKALQNHVLVQKKNRLATDLGAFSILMRRFRFWVGISIYKRPLVHKNDDLSQQEADQETHHRENGMVMNWKKDSEWRSQGLVLLPLEADKLRHDLVLISQANEARMHKMEDLEHQLREKKHIEEVFLRKEVASTLKMRAGLMQQSQQIMKTRAHKMHDVLDRAFDDLGAQKRLQTLKSSFRAIRVVMMLKYTTTICHRAQIKNWLRLCKKFQFWETKMTKFYELKRKFHVLRTLLRHVVWKWKHESPGFSQILSKRQLLVYKYDQYLDSHGLLNGSSSASRLAMTKYSPANTSQGVFLRWVQFTQFTKTYRETILIFQRKRELWKLFSVFQILKIPTLKTKYTFTKRLMQKPFLLRQCEADLDAIYCKLFCVRARLRTQKLRKQLHHSQRLLQHTATGAPTLKQRFKCHEEEIRHRLFLESRLMFVAYSERKTHHFAERSSQLVGAPIGRSFSYEMAPPYASISDIVVLCGKKVDALAVVLKTNASVSLEGALHGNPFGNREVFTIPKHEKLVFIEVFASQTIYGIRFGTNTGKLSKWYGHCEKGTKFEFRAENGQNNKKEEIVGFFGFADATSLHSIGCVFRHTTLRNIFEGMWLQPGSSTTSGHSTTAATTPTTTATLTAGNSSTSASSSSDHQTQHQQHPQNGDTATGGGSSEHGKHGGAVEMPLCDRQFAYFLQVRLCDVLLAMKRAHTFALRMHRMAHTLPVALTRTRVAMALMRWFFNAMAHGLVHSSDREDEGKKILQDGMNKRALGEKTHDEGTRLLAEVDSYRDEEKQLNVATLGVKKMNELKEMIEQGEFKIAHGKTLMDDGHKEILQGRHILPHIPMTKRMMNAIRRMYKVVQTKDYIDQMDPELRAILLEGDAGASDTPISIYDQL